MESRKRLPQTYLAAIHKDEDSDFTALFPGVPGCITAGSTMEELEAMARQALQGHLEVLRDSGDPVPEPLDIDAAKAHEDGKGAAFILAVPVYLAPGKRSG
jgi:predicted RNase H-like HicB family nuclease